VCSEADPEQDAELGAVPPRTGAADDVLLIRDDVGDIPQRYAIRECAVIVLGWFFSCLAVVAVAVGLVCVAGMFQRGKNAIEFAALNALARRVLPTGGDNEMPWLLITVGIPVLLAVVSAWLFLRLGQGLRRQSAAARWVALLLLAPLSVPPLVLLFQATWGRAYWVVAAAAVILAVPAGYALLLAAPACDPLFRPEYSALARATPLRYAETASKLGVIALGLIVMFALLLFAR